MSHYETTIEFNIRLVRTVQKYPNIYNYQLLEYSNRRQKQRAWDMIAAEIGLTVPQCKEKWRNLRICYTEYVRKFSTDTPEHLKSRTYLTAAMHFLRPFIQKRGDCNKVLLFEADTTDTSDVPTVINPKVENANETVIINDDDSNDDDLIEVKFSEIIQKHDLNKSQVADISNTSILNSTELPDLIGTKQKLEWTEPNHVDNIDSGANNTVLLNSNSRHQFLMSILPDLEKMNDRQMRKFRSRVSTAIEEILENE